MMFISEYEKVVMGLRKPTANDVYAREGMVAEMGEYFDKRAKGIRDGFKADHKEAVGKELGDILWMLTAVANDEGFTLEQIAKMNMEKLLSRKARGVLQGSGDNR